MATVDILPPDVLPPSDLSFEYALETVERWAKSGPTDDEILEFLENAIKDLGEPGNVEIFRAAMVELGKRVGKTTAAFDRVDGAMETFVREHWINFPGVVPFRKEWYGHKSRWNFLITTSQLFAVKTNVEYRIYKLHLLAVNSAKTKEQLDAVADGLKKFAENVAIGIPTNFKDYFLELRRDVADFQRRFNAYLDQKGVDLENRAKALKNEIESLKLQVESLDKQVKAATTALKIASFFGPLGAAIAGSALAKLAKQRANKQKELDGKKAELQRVEALQTVLAKIKAQFAGSIPDFALLSETLNLLADTWNAFHNEALDFATKFKSLEKPDKLPELYKAKVRLALAVAVPLSQGLIDYTAAVQS